MVSFQRLSAGFGTGQCKNPDSGKEDTSIRTKRPSWLLPSLLFSWRFPCSIAGEYSQEWHRTRFPRCATPYTMTSDGDLLPWVILAKYTNTSASREMSLLINTNTDNIHTTNHKWSCVSLGSWRVKNRGNTEKTKSYTTSQKTTKFPHIKKFADFLKIFSYPFWFEKGMRKFCNFKCAECSVNLFPIYAWKVPHTAI